MFSWPVVTSYMMTSYDLYGGNRPAVALASLPDVFVLSRIARFIMHVEKQLKRSTTVNTCIKLDATWPWQQGHSSPTKGHMNLPLTDQACVKRWESNQRQKWDVGRLSQEIYRAARKNCPGDIHPLPQVRARVNMCTATTACQQGFRVNAYKNIQNLSINEPIKIPRNAKEGS